MTLLEVAFSLAIVATVLLSVASAFSSSLVATSRAKRMTDGAVFLDTVLVDLSAQPYDNVLALNGNAFFDGPVPDTSEFAVNLSVFTTTVDLLQIDAVLTDLESGRPLARISTLRSRK